MSVLSACSKFKGENGTVRVYDYPLTAPDGYPYAVVGSESLESTVLDNTSDTRLYNFRIQIVGEKFGSEGGLSQSDALGAMRTTEDAVLAIFDSNNDIDNPALVIRTMPTLSEYGTTDGGSRIVLTIQVKVETRVSITY